jgi:hypothetical protein
MTRNESDDTPPEISYYPSLELAYTAGGETYKAELAQPGIWDPEDEAARLFEAYPLGSEVTVYDTALQLGPHSVRAK